MQWSIGTYKNWRDQNQLSNKTITSSILELITLSFYLLLALSLSKSIGYVGMAIASSASAVFSILSSLIFTHRIIKFPIPLFLKGSCKIFLSAAASAAISYLPYYFLSPVINRTVVFIGTAGIFSISYLCFIWLIKIDEATNLANIFFRVIHSKFPFFLKA